MKTRLNRKSALSGSREPVKRGTVADFCMSMTKISYRPANFFRRMDIVIRGMSAFSSMRCQPKTPISNSLICLVGLSHAHITREDFARKALSADFFNSIFLNKLTNKCRGKASFAKIIPLDFVHLALRANTSILSLWFVTIKQALSSLRISQIAKTGYSKPWYHNTVHSTKKFRFVTIVVKKVIKSQYVKKTILIRLSLIWFLNQIKWILMWYVSNASSMVIMPIIALGGCREGRLSPSLRACWARGSKGTSPRGLRNTFYQSGERRLLDSQVHQPI